MKRLLSLWQALGFAVTGVLGVLLHFVFEWTNGSVFVAPFSAVNESIWEHTKLIFFPMFVFAIIEYMNIGGKYKNFWCVKLIGTLLGIVSILVLYYTINGIFGKTPDFVNIVIFGNPLYPTKAQNLVLSVVNWTAGVILSLTSAAARQEYISIQITME